ncbi:hypothetical protein AB8880_10870 [Alphaproteobacteria bacterium LSUCC0684]
MLINIGSHGDVYKQGFSKAPVFNNSTKTWKTRMEKLVGCGAGFIEDPAIRKSV